MRRILSVVIAAEPKSMYLRRHEGTIVGAGVYK